MKKLLCLFVAGALLSSCEKKSDDTTTDPDPTPTAPSPTVNIPGVMGSLVAVKSSSTVTVPGLGDQTTIIGTATANFSDGTSTSVSAGTVECMNQKLTSQNGAYFYKPGFTNPSGIDFDGSAVEWDVAGNGSIPAFSYNYMEEVPQIGGITGASGDVKRSEDLTISIDMGNVSTDISSADSLMFNVIDKNGKTLMQTTAPNTTSYTFSASQMGTLAEGFAYVQVVGYNYLLRTETGYEVAYINLGAMTKNVTLK
ncbi:hypothetical protein [Owenweeksia hongkongensis]|uniref:hypothetical protein n=1 Tax=Owenweeksia hongkongensis TaxID=253245 RepID=UPI0005A25D65|nr:hypothetical protein [Owenweeksia hongkongensis]